MNWKRLINFYHPSKHAEVESFVRWVSSTIPNANWQEWIIRNHCDNPSHITPQVRETLTHYSGMTYLPFVKSVRFEPHDTIKTGLNKFKQAERQAIDFYKQKTHYIKPNKEAKLLVRVSPNRGWFDLGVSYSKDEGAAMGHCGNVEGKRRTTDRILSLREVVQIGQHTFHQPHLTFIINRGYLGEMKGRGNEKPHPRYHADIVELLKHPSIKGIVGGGYLPGNNFHWNDFKAEYQQEILKIKPNFIPHPDNVEYIDKLLQDVELPEHFFNYVFKLLLFNAPLSDPAMDRLVQHPDYSVREAIARNPNLDPKYHEKLVRDPHGSVREAIARNPNLDPKYHEKLVRDEKWNVREAIARNPNLDPKYHEKLVRDEKWNVREAIARNPNLDPKYHEKLVHDGEWVVRAAIAHTRCENVR